jgi:Family of unknown function (DUF6114)
MTSSQDKGSAAGSGAALPGGPGQAPGSPSPTTTLSDLLAGPAGPAPAAGIRGPGASAVSATQQPAPPPPQRGFRAWRRARPFWGGVLLTLAGGEIFATGIAPMRIVIHLGLEGIAGQAVPIVIVVCGLLMLFNPQQRLFYTIIGMLLTAASWVTSNLGGFIVGLLLGLIGCSLAFAWSPPEDSEPAAG